MMLAEDNLKQPRPISSQPKEKWGSIPVGSIRLPAQVNLCDHFGQYPREKSLTDSRISSNVVALRDKKIRVTWTSQRDLNSETRFGHLLRSIDGKISSVLA